MLVIAILAGCLLAVIQSSFFEWAFHRYWLHRPWMPKDCFTTHTLIHHQLCKFEDTFHVVEEEQEEALHFQWWGGPTLVSINIVPWVLLAWVLATRGVGLPYLAFLTNYPAPHLLHLFPYELACRYQCVPVGAERNMLTLATCHWLNREIVTQLRTATHRGIFQVRCEVTMIDEILRYWQRLQGTLGKSCNALETDEVCSSSR